MEQKSMYDVIVLGGGPAGMIAAGRAAECGVRVLLLEKNDRLGVKLRMTGGGRCNLTHAGIDTHEYVRRLGKNGSFLYSALTRFGIDETLRHFQLYGVSTYTTPDGCVFPTGDNSREVIQALEHYMKKNDVAIKTQMRVSSIVHDSQLFRVYAGEQFCAPCLILATGGISYPSTGSSGDGYTFAQSLGHTVREVSPGLTPLMVKESWINEMQGISLETSFSAYGVHEKLYSGRGAVLFTHEGLSGPAILDSSAVIAQALKEGEVKVFIDMVPSIKQDVLERRLKEDLERYEMKKIKNILEPYGSLKVILVWCKRAGIDPDRKGNTITTEERHVLSGWMKKMPYTIQAVSGYDKAMVTCGGVSLKEINGKTMQSQRVKGLFFAGELMDLDGPCGGYNLQIAWTTGYVAGESAAYALKNEDDQL